MSLVGFRAQNHPQQEAKAEVDDRAITDADFAFFTDKPLDFSECWDCITNRAARRSA